MVRCLLVYYSLGGTTERIANKIAIGLENTGYTVDKLNIKDGVVPPIENYDLLGIGTPSYCFSPPFLITDYLISLPKSIIPFFTFVLYGSIIGDAGNWMRKRLTKKGGRDVGYFKCNGVEQFLGYIQRGVETYPTHPDVEDLKHAEDFGKSIKSNINNKEYQPEDFDKKPNLVYRFERFMNQKWMIQKIFYRFFKVKKSKCTKCGICSKICPTTNINMENGEFPQFGKNCIACFYCELRCPQEAISSIMDWKLFSPFIAYNVRKIPDIPSIESHKIKLVQGKVEKID